MSTQSTLSVNSNHGGGSGKGFPSDNSAFSFQNLSPYNSLAYYSLDSPVSNVFASKFSTFSITDRKNGNKYNYIKTLVKHQQQQESEQMNNSGGDLAENNSNNNNKTRVTSINESFIDIDSSKSVFQDSMGISNENNNNNATNGISNKNSKAIYIENNSFNSNPAAGGGKQACVDYNPCRHGQCRLSNVSNDFTCECNVGYMGPFCDLIRHPCDFKPCENGICEIVGDLYYKCLCKPNYTGINCHIEIKPCGPTTCLNGGKCKSMVSHDETEIGCDCPSNYTGIYCENCKL